MQNECFPNASSSWERRPISFLARINPRYPLKKGQVLPFVEMAAVAEQFGGIQSFGSRKFEGSGLSRFKLHDTLFAKITPCPENGKVAFVCCLSSEYGIGSTEFIVLSPKEGCDPRFVYHLVCDHAVRGRAASRMEGSTGRQRVPDDVFEKRLLVPIPSNDDQAAIAIVLDAIEDAIERCRSNVVAAERLNRAVVQHFFFSALGETAYADRPLKDLPQGWSLVPAEKLLLGEPKNGFSPEATAQPPGTPTFSIGAIRNGKIDLDNPVYLKFARIPEKIAANFRLNQGDILIVRGNANPDLVGKAGIVDGFPPACIYPDIAKRIVFRRDGDTLVTPEFGVIAWNHPIVHNQILRRAKTSNGTLKINNRDVKQVIIPVPTPGEQRMIVKLVSTINTSIKHLSTIMVAYRHLKYSLMYDLLTGRAKLSKELLDSLDAR